MWTPEERTEYSKKYWIKNKEKLTEYNKKRNIEKKEQNKIAKQIYGSENREKIMLLCAKRTAINKGIPFNLEISDINIPDTCPYLKVKITKERGKGRVWTNASLDRIVPELGYIKGNIEVISMLANVMKNQATKEQLIQFAKSVLEKEILK